MKKRDIAAEYFHFSRRDRLAILVLCALISGVFLFPRLLAGGKSPKPGLADTAWISALKKLEQSDSANSSQRTGTDNYNTGDETYAFDKAVSSRPYNQPELFYFDPNTLTDDGWKKLGIREKTVRTIRNYLAKGGHFRKAEDVKKVYGLFPDEYERIAPYINIAEHENTVQNYPVPERAAEKTPSSRYSVIDINMADTSAFISLPGIGSKLASRIINFRDKLGGFYSVSQVAETYGLPDSTFQKIRQYLKLENISVRKININTATADELKAHPYIRYSLANPIVAYRKEHGPFSKAEDIKRVMAVTEEIYQKLAPYLEVR